MIVTRTLTDFFIPIEKYVPAELVAPASLAKCRALTAHFPAGMSRHFGFECRLNVHEADVGFAFSILPGSPGWNFLTNLADDKPGQLLPRSAFDIPAWKQIQAVCTETENLDSPLYKLLLEGLWIEYDIVRIDAPLQSPDFFLPFKLARMKIVDPRPTLSYLLRLLLKEQASPLVEANLVHCMARLPSVAEINQIGAMMGRAGANVRLVVTFPDVASAAAYLLSLGWQDDYGALDAACTWFAALGDVYTLQIDFNDTPTMISPRVGLETRFNQIPGSPKRWHNLFDALERQKLCSPEEREALERFPRLVQEVVTLPMAYHLGISHLKLVLYPDCLPEAKVYFGAIIDVWNVQP
jgi:hypothetical protein